MTGFVWIAPAGAGRRQARGRGSLRGLLCRVQQDDHAETWSTPCANSPTAKSISPGRFPATAPGLGRYMFFYDLEAATDSAVTRPSRRCDQAESVRIFGCCPFVEGTQGMPFRRTRRSANWRTALSMPPVRRASPRVP